MQMSEDKILQEELFIFTKMAEGDQGALRFFFDKYYDDLCHFINTYIHNHVISEEIVQDIFIQFWDNKKELNLSYSVKGYLYKLSKNRSLNHIRDEKRKRRIYDTILADYTTVSIEDDSYLDNEQFRLIITTAIKGLPAQCREIYALCKEGHLTYKEVAEKMGISVKTVENQMGIALKKLKANLLPYYDKIFILLIINVLRSI
jgi:RNA polymerase sigma-70 factor, ECF subfamily